MYKYWCVRIYNINVYNVTAVSEVWKAVYSYTNILVDNTQKKLFFFRKTQTGDNTQFEKMYEIWHIFYPSKQKCTLALFVRSYSYHF